MSGFPSNALPPAGAIVRLLDAGALTQDALAPFLGWLDPTERERLHRFVRPARRRQFVAGRVLARQLIGRLAGVAPDAVRLVDRPGAAPLLVLPGDGQVGFSISHSGRWVACAADAAGRVGLDIEVIDPARDIEALAVQAFDGDRQAWLAARPLDTRLHDFYRMWSREEAAFKLGVPSSGTFDLSRPELSIVLCCEARHAHPPTLALQALAG